MINRPFRWGVITLLTCLGVSFLIILPTLAGPAVQKDGPGFTMALPAVPGPASQIETITYPIDGSVRGERGPQTRFPDPAAADRWVLSTPPEPFALFEPYTIFAAGLEAKAVAIDDFNGDGRSDVALAVGWPANQLYVFLQTVTGTLTTPVQYPTGPQPDVLAAGDLNGDLRADIVVGNFLSDTIGVYRQLPSGALAAPAYLDTGRGPNAIVVGDINEDDLADVIVTHWLEPTLGVFIQKLEGTLADESMTVRDLVNLRLGEEGNGGYTAAGS